MALGYNRPDDLPFTLSTVMQDIIDDKTVDVSQGIIHHKEGVDLIPSNIELSGLEVRLINALSRESANSHFLRTAGPHFPDSPGHIKRTAWDISRAEGTPPH